ncbi:NEDD8-specific protease 1 [Morus notabilis]|uniref:NEDD8-specific protease 1 n=1 Tax=Morus notabilis TaxID=981085 RepID=W9SIH8_9ROSA|nr:NEDD8-specific protease 1 [Morus notabilis]XP_024031783.1 NEDD8-specific protease 1 [Morus notabilis]XP_024031784.1 NEDD8-specific protease 1 [Morus notabilis]XP_024031785.1 NEDD8-specific protease 1 [Morus notabilis]EXC33239.1 NEDD8-specific protease 1 [Morus notabilis]
MGGSNPDEKVLSYNDVVLRRSDLDILSGPYFLNDRIIEFYFSYLSSCYPSEDVLLVPPSISFWIMSCPVIESLKDFVEPLHLPDRKLVLFPTNDNDDVSQAEGGSHWSLLAYERNSNMFVHHDSHRGMNKRHAKQLYNAVKGFMSDTDSVSAAKFLECADSPQQTNGCDCGLYVTAISRVICLWHGDGGNKDKGEGDLWLSAVKEQVTPSVVAEMRNEILGLIRGLMAMK